MPGLQKYFLDTPYQVIDGNIVYASNLNTPLAAIATGLETLSVDVQTGGSKYGADTGSGNAYAVTLDPAPTELAEGLEVWLKTSTTNTGPATLDVNSLGPVEIRRHGLEPLIEGDISANYFVLLKLSGGYFQIVSASGRSNAEASEDAAAASAVEAAASAVEAAASAAASAASAVEAASQVVVYSATRTANFTAVKNNVYPLNSNGGAFTVTLPLNPAHGDTLSLINTSDDPTVTPPVIDGNGSNINNISEDWVLDVGWEIKLSYIDGSWRIK